MKAVVRCPSLSHHGVTYAVERTGDSLACECPRFVFARKASQGCGHTLIVARADRLLVRCAEAHGLTEPPALCRQCLVELLALSARKVRAGYVTKEAAKEKVAKARKRRTRKAKTKE